MRYFMFVILPKLFVPIYFIVSVLFPSNKMALALYQYYTDTPAKTITAQMESSVKSGDPSDLENLFSDYCKENIEDLHKQIVSLLESIDGNFVETTEYNIHDLHEFFQGGGNLDYIDKGSVGIKFRTETKQYVLKGCWYSVNTNDPKKAWLRCS